MRAVKLFHLYSGVLSRVKRGKAFLLAELLIRQIRTMCCPVVIRVIVDIILFVLDHGVADVHSHCIAGSGKDIIQQGTLIQHGGGKGKIFGIHKAGRGSDQYAHLARMAGCEFVDGCNVFGQLAFFIVGQRKLLGIQAPAFANKNIAKLGLFENQALCAILHTDKAIAQRELVFQIIAVFGGPLVLQKAAHAEFGALLQAGVFQCTDLTIRPKHAQQHHADNDHRKHDNARVATQSIQFFR